MAGKLIPILMQPDLVNASKRKKDPKTITRRQRGLKIINENPDNWFLPYSVCLTEEKGKRFLLAHFKSITDDTVSEFIKCPFGLPGDILWVRETFRKYNPTDENGYIDWDKEVVEYCADFPPPIYQSDGDGGIAIDSKGQEKYVPWTPNIHMNFKYCRLFLKIKSIRIERVQSISDHDAMLEGAERGIFREGPKSGEYHLEHNYHSPYINGFKYLWYRINGIESWNKNIWVWVIEFEQTEKP